MGPSGGIIRLNKVSSVTFTVITIIKVIMFVRLIRFWVNRFVLLLLLLCS